MHCRMSKLDESIAVTGKFFYTIDIYGTANLGTVHM